MPILTPDQRVRVFVSSTLDELAEERAAARRAVESLHLVPVLFELGARPHPPQELYRAYLDQSHVVVAIYWQRYGWVAPDMEVSGLEDEWLLAGSKPRLVYLKRPAPEREERLDAMLERVRDSGVSYKPFGSADELQQLIARDLSTLLSERFQASNDGSSMPANVSLAGSLPVSTTSFVGRHTEVEDVLSLLRRDDVRLVTLVGSGGIGKTRLALHVAELAAGDFPDGAVFVALDSIHDGAFIAHAILRALDVHDRGGEATMDVVCSYVRNRRMLLVVDNFEHVLAGAEQIGALLASSTLLKVLVTSREPLRVRAEHEYQVSSLSEDGASALFADRARAVAGIVAVDDANDEAVRQICRRLDGVPLAIELAAARTRVLSPHAILERLGKRLDFLVAGARDLPARQRALRSTIQWSYDLLDADQRRAFAALGVFQRSFTEAAAAEVTGEADPLELIASLVDKCLLLVEPAGDQLRVRMLGMVREFALEQLVANGELDAYRARHARYCRRVAVEAAGPLRSADQTRWLDVLDADVANLRASLDWFLDQGDLDVVAEIVWNVWLFAWLRGYLHEARDLVATALATNVDGHARTRLLVVAGLFEVYGGGSDGAALLSDAAARARAEGLPDVLATASVVLAMTGGGGDFDEALTLFRELGDQWAMALTLCAKSWAHVYLGAFDGADEVFEAALESVRHVQDDLVVAMILSNASERSTHQGDLVEAARLLTDSVGRYQRLRAAFPASYALEAAAHLTSKMNRLECAVQSLSAAEAMRASINVPMWVAAQPRHTALVAWLREGLDPEAFEAAWQAGHDLDYTAALDYVVEAIVA